MLATTKNKDVTILNQCAYPWMKVDELLLFFRVPDQN